MPNTTRAHKQSSVKCPGLKYLHQYGATKLTDERHKTIKGTPKNWDQKICALACFYMLLHYYGNKTPLDTLIKTYGYTPSPSHPTSSTVQCYFPGPGWSLKGLAKVATDFNLTGTWKQYKSPTLLLKFLQQNITQHIPVILRLNANGTDFAKPSTTGHIVVVSGIKKQVANKPLETVFLVHDPAHKSRKGNVAVPAPELLRAVYNPAETNPTLNGQVLIIKPK